VLHGEQYFDSFGHIGMSSPVWDLTP
jgi:hypothetical protein